MWTSTWGWTPSPLSTCVHLSLTPSPSVWAVINGWPLSRKIYKFPLAFVQFTFYVFASHILTMMHLRISLIIAYSSFLTEKCHTLNDIYHHKSGDLFCSVSGAIEMISYIYDHCHYRQHKYTAWL